MVTGAPESTKPQITAEDIHRQQRANLVLRALDLEADNIILQQEIQRLKARIEEFESASTESLPTVKPSNVAKRAVQ